MISVDAHIEDTERLTTALTQMSNRTPEVIDKMLDELGIFAQMNMLLYVDGRLARKIERRDTHRTASGAYEQEVGAVGPQLWPLYVHEGTGIYGDRRAPITAREDRTYGPARVIATRRRRLTAEQGGVLRWQGRDGRIYYRRSVLGQKPNPFVERAYTATKIFAGARVLMLGRTILS